MTCQDIDLDGQIDLDGPDRVSGQFAYYEHRPAETLNDQPVTDGWWRVSGSFVYPEEHGATPLTNGLSRTRLSGLGQAGAYGQLTGETVSVDPRGNATLSRQYLDRDAHRTVRWTRLPDSIQPEIAFMIAGHTVSNITRSGVVTQYEYDAFGRQTAAWSESANGTRTVASYTHYNNKGQVDWIEDAAGNRTSYAYDWWGRRSTTTDAMNQTTHTSYTDDGKVLATWGATYPVAYEYDAWGRLVAMATTRDPAYANQNLWNLLGYDLFLIDTDDPDYPSELDTTLWHYDLPTGLLTGKTYSDGQGPSYSYTPDGKLASRTWARGVTTSYAYTNGASLAAIAYSDDTPPVSFTMNRLGLQSHITDVTGSRVFTFTDAMQLAAETNAYAALNRTHDDLGRSDGYQITAGATDLQNVAYAYSDMGRFSSLSSKLISRTNLWNYTYLANADLISGWSNGIITTVKCFETNRNLITQVRHAAGGTLVSQFDYANDELGRRTQRLDTGSVVTTNLFAYDARNQLTNAVMKDYDFAWVIDAIGNRVSDTSNSVTHEYTANALNQYEQITNGGVRNLAYDVDGNLTNDSVFAYVWDGENRLVGVNGGGVEALYRYDYMSRRAEKTVNGVTNRFIYDGWNLAAETSTAGVTNFYDWGTDLSGGMQGAGGIGGLLAVIRNGETYYPFADANGNITDYVDANGTLVAHREFDAYGNTLAATGPMVNDFNFWFSSKYLDHETGLHYYGYRYYAPVIERWMNRDPIHEWGGIHLYGYIGNNAVNWIDYLGLTPPALHEFFVDAKKQAKYNVTELLDVFAYCHREASALRKFGNALTLGLTGGSLTRTAISESDTTIDCNCGHIVIVINPRLGRPPEIRTPVDNPGVGFFGLGHGEIPGIFKPGEGWTPPDDLWGEAEKVNVINRGPGGEFEYPIYEYSKANFNVGRFIDHKKKSTGSWNPVKFDENMFNIWHTDFNSVNTWQMNASVGPVVTGDQLSIQIGCGGENKLAWHQLLTIK